MTDQSGPARGLALSGPAGAIELVQRMGRAVLRTPGVGVLWAPPRAAGFALGAIVRERLGIADPDIPRTRPTLALTAQVALDEAVLGVMRGPRRYPTDGDFHNVRRELDAALAFQRTRGWSSPSTYHPDPPPLTDVTRSGGWAMGTSFERISWPSEFAPAEGEPARERWLAYERNRTAYAYLVRSAPERPWLVCVHGFGTGVPTADFFAFRARRLAEELRLNLAFPVLPLHGPRRASRLSGAELLSFNLLDFVYGMAQSVWDLRRFVRWLRAEGATRLGVYGMSLGSYVAALLTSLEPGLDLAVAGVPLCDMPRLLDHHTPARLRARARAHGLGPDRLNALYRVVSPLAAPPLISPDRAFLYAGIGDRMSTPGQAHRLWRHWGEPRVLWYEGGHLTFLWSSQVARFLDEALREVGFVTDGQRRA